MDKTSLMLADADGGNVRLLSSQTVSENNGHTFATLQFVGERGPVTPTWSLDGATIAVPGVRYPDNTQFVMFVTATTGFVEAVPLHPAGPGGGWVHAHTLLWSKAAGPGEPQQLYTVSHPSGRSRRLTTDLSDYGSLSLSRQRNAFVTVQSDSEADIWIRDDSGKETIPNTSAVPPFGGERLAWLGKRLVYAARSGDERGLWTADTVNPASDAQQLVRSGGLPSASADGTVIIYLARDPGSENTLWKANHEGRYARQVATDVFWPVIHPTGHEAVFVRRMPDGLVTMWRVALDEGRQEEIVHLAAGKPDISPDGRRLAFVTVQPGHDGAPRDVIGFCELPRCSSVSVLPAPDMAWATPIRWTPDSTGVAYVHAGGSQNIWIQPLKGSARFVTQFADGLTIRGFAWSRDRTLAVLRERNRTDVVLFRGLLNGPAVQNP